MTPLTVLYDEGCGFCTAVARRLERRDGIVAAPIGSPVGDNALRDLSHEQRYASFHVLDGEGRRFSAGEALAVLLSALPGGAATSRLAHRFPRATEAVYRQIADRRDLLGRLFRVDAGRVEAR